MKIICPSLLQTHLAGDLQLQSRECFQKETDLGSCFEGWRMIVVLIPKLSSLGLVCSPSIPTEFIGCSLLDKFG